MTDEIVIAAARRTPIGAFQGALAPVSAPDLGATAAAAAIEDCGVKPEDISEVIFGCVLPAGLGQAPARQAALGGGVRYRRGARRAPFPAVSPRIRRAPLQVFSMPTRLTTRR